MSHHNAVTLQLDHTHCRAICDEIGERLREVLQRNVTPTPAYLLALIEKLAELDDAPSIVPSIGDLTSLGERYRLA
jgi:hypothetical protein